MKIISYEKNNTHIENNLKKDLLIPCLIYKIPIEVSRNKNLNFIEETVLKLIQIDNTLKDDITRLSKMIGFYSEKKDNDKTKIVNLIVNKLKDLKMFNTYQDEENNEVIVYQFYREIYTNKLLPIITKEINKFSYVDKSINKYKDNEQYKQIIFKKDISSKKPITAILVKHNNNLSQNITKEEVIKTIYQHNQQKYKNNGLIDYKNFKIDTIGSPELVYLHVKYFITKNIESFVITNGFTNDFSFILRYIFETNHSELLNLFRNELKTDTNQQNYDLKVPFEDKINQFLEVKKLIQDIEFRSIQSKQDNSKEQIKKIKNRLALSLYDVIEKSFESLSQNMDDSNDLKNQKLLEKLAIKTGFNIDTNITLPIFKVHNNDNLQKYFAKTLIYKKDELYEIALKYPNILFILKILFDFRNGLKHSQKDELLKQIDIDKLLEYKEIVYQIISIVLHIKPKDIEQSNLEIDEDIYFTNAYIDLENEFNIDIFNLFPQEIKENLKNINFYLNDLEFKINQHNIVKEVLNNLYSSLELLLRINISKLPNKASLGYIYNYLKNNENISNEHLKLIDEIISLRKHGNPTIEETSAISKDKLKKLKERCYLYINKLAQGEI